MAFRFALAPLLRLRQSLEHQRALELRRACVNLNDAEEMLRRLEHFLDESIAADSRALTTGCPAAELHFAHLLREQLERSREQLRSVILRLRIVREEAADKYQKALGEREMLENLRNQQRRGYEAEQTRREQRELDSSYLMRSWNCRRG